MATASSVSFTSSWGLSPSTVRRHVATQGQFWSVGGIRRSDLAAQWSDQTTVGMCMHSRGSYARWLHMGCRRRCGGWSM
jgi:hypothetical protein